MAWPGTPYNGPMGNDPQFGPNAERVARIRDDQDTLATDRAELDRIRTRISQLRDEVRRNPGFAPQAANEARRLTARAQNIRTGAQVIETRYRPPTREEPLRRSFGQRLRDSIAEGAEEGMVGWTIRRGADAFNYGMGEAPHLTDEQRETAHDEAIRRVSIARRREFARKREEDGPDSIGDYLTEFGGHIIGSADPTYLLGPGRTVLQRVAAQAGINAGMDAVTQGLEIGEGIRDSVDPTRIALSLAAGGAFQGTGEAIRGGVRAFRNNRTATRRRGEVISRAQENTRWPGTPLERPALVEVEFDGEVAARTPGYTEDGNWRPDEGGAPPNLDVERAEDLPRPSNESFDETARIMERYDDEALPNESREQFLIRKTQEEEAANPMPRGDVQEDADRLFVQRAADDRRGLTDRRGAFGGYRAGPGRRSGDERREPTPSQDEFGVDGVLDFSGRASRAEPVRLYTTDEIAQRTASQPVPDTQAATSSSNLGTLNRLRIEPHEGDAASELGFTKTIEFVYRTHDDIEAKITLAIKDDGMAEVDVFPTMRNWKDAGPNSFGPRVIRDAMRQIQAMHPEIEGFRGYRVSGAGPNRVQTVKPHVSKNDADKLREEWGEAEDFYNETFRYDDEALESLTPNQLAVYMRRHEQAWNRMNRAAANYYRAIGDADQEKWYLSQINNRTDGEQIDLNLRTRGSSNDNWRESGEVSDLADIGRVIDPEGVYRVESGGGGNRAGGGSGGRGGQGGGSPPPPPRGPDDGAPEAPKRGPERAGNVNLDRLATTEDAKQVLRDHAANWTGDRVTHGETLARAEAMLDEHGVYDIINVRDVPEADLAAYSAAIRAVDEAAARRTAELAKEVVDPSLSTPDLQRQFLESRLLSAAAFERTSGVAATAGRLLNAHRIVIGGGKLSRKARADLENLLANEPDPVRLANLINDFADDPIAVAKLARDSVKPHARDYIFSYWYNWGLLSNPATHAANIFGNTSNFAVDLVEHGLAAAYGLRRIGSKQADRVTGREFFARVGGAVEGLKAAFTPTVRMPDGRMMSPARAAFELGTPLDLAERTERGGPVFKNKALEAPTRAIAWQDEVFRQVSAISHLRGLAMRQAVKETGGKMPVIERLNELFENPTDEMMKSAAEYSRRMRFQDTPGKFGLALENARRINADDNIFQRTWAGALRFNVPFVRTISSLFRTAARRSPLGFTESVNVADWKAGGARRDLAIARVTLGTAVTAYIGSLIADGAITGLGPADWRKREELQASGWQPNSIKVNGTYYSYQGLEPLSIILSTMATTAERYDSASNDPENDPVEVATITSLGLADAMVSNSWMESLTALFGIIGGSESGQETNLANFLAQTAGSLAVPAIIAGINQTYLDPMQRETTLDGSLIGRTKGRVMSRMPGLSDDLPIKHDVYGRPIERGEPLGPDIFSRVRQRREDTDPTIAELQRLSRGQTTALVGPPGKANINVNGVRRRLNSREFQDYQRLSGQFIYDDVNELMRHEYWPTWDDAARREEIKKIVEDARRDAREELFGSDPEEDDIDETPVDTGGWPGTEISE